MRLQNLETGIFGRLDDKGENGMDLIAHIVKMFRNGDGHVEVLTASVK